MGDYTEEWNLFILLLLTNLLPIHETDPVKKKLLERFFIDAKSIEEKKKLYGGTQRLLL